ncbi:MAG TPA: hypothetical protein VKF42_10870 [Chitinivibrionales bacterium]|nr:hypothetical protein [Chitinivibrionales bacterium]
MRPRFFKRREFPVPTAWAWCVALAAIAALLLVFIFTIHSFLAPVNPVSSRIMVVEGWLPEYTLARAAEDFRSKGFRLLIVTGGPVEVGHFLTGYNSLANVGAATLRKLGIDSSAIVVVPAPFVQKDRTYEEAVSLKHWLLQSSTPEKSLTLYSIGCHSRRSHLLYARVLGREYTVGIVACVNRDYDSRHWWHYSNGVRAVADETLAYCYAWVFSLFAGD